MILNLKFFDFTVTLNKISEEAAQSSDTANEIQSKCYNSRGILMRFKICKKVLKSDKTSNKEEGKAEKLYKTVNKKTEKNIREEERA